MFRMLNSCGSGESDVRRSHQICGVDVGSSSDWLYALLDLHDNESTTGRPHLRNRGQVSQPAGRVGQTVNHLQG